MKTPIQELISYFRYDENEEAIRPAKLFLGKEKEFARMCFDAGEKFGIDSSYSIEWGTYGTEPDFDNFYKQYE